jgi:hypothetical protein
MPNRILAVITKAPRSYHCSRSICISRYLPISLPYEIGLRVMVSAACIPISTWTTSIEKAHARRVCQLVNSPDKLECTLNFSRRISDENLAEAGSAKVGGWIAEVRMIEKVEKLRPELKIQALPDGKALRQSEVDVLVLRAL